MNSKGKGIITAVIVVLIALAAFCGFGYISQRMTASEGITYLDKKEYQKAYEQFDHAAGKFTLIFTKQKKDVLFYEGEALYQMGEYGKAIEIYDQLIDHGESRAYSLKAYCLAQQKKLNKAIDVCESGNKRASRRWRDLLYKICGVSKAGEVYTRAKSDRESIKTEGA